MAISLGIRWCGVISARIQSRLSVCLCVCGCVCLSVCLSVLCALMFESLNPENSFLVCRYVFEISRSLLYIKVIGSRSRSQQQEFMRA